MKLDYIVTGSFTESDTQEPQCTDHDMEFYEFEDQDGYFHGYECSSCGELQSG